MKIDEAISLLRQYIDYDNPDVSDFYTMEEACKVVIKALEQEPCDNCINRQEVLDVISELNAISFYEAQEDSKKCYYEIRNAIKQLPSVTSHQKMGHWIYTGDYITDGMLKCSECGFEHDVSERFSYCPNCGAKMQEVEE